MFLALEEGEAIGSRERRGKLPYPALIHHHLLLLLLPPPIEFRFQVLMAKKMNVCSSLMCLVFLFSIYLNLVLTSSLRSIPVVSRLASSPGQYIIYADTPTNEEPEAFDLRILTSVLGSVEAAKESLVHTYKSAASGFSARLTPEQVAEISKQPGVLNVVQSVTSQLHDVGGGGGGISTLH